jgi:plastocyanin
MVKASRTTIDVALGDLLNRHRAIAIHGEEGDAVITCGDFAGKITDGRLTIGLREEAGSGLAGIAELSADEDRTAITLYLAQGLMAPRPDVQPGAASQAAVEITMAGGAFSPSRVEIVPGTTVIWINNDGVAHEVSSELSSFVHSGVLDPGDSVSQTFSEPGTIDFQCAFHPGMAGTIVVT